jgi:hypothetical protein
MANAEQSSPVCLPLPDTTTIEVVSHGSALLVERIVLSESTRRGLTANIKSIGPSSAVPVASSTEG